MADYPLTPFQVRRKGENIREGIGKVADPLYQGILDTGDFLGSIPEKSFGYLLDGLGIGSQALGFPGSDWLAGSAYHWGDEAKKGFPNLFKFTDEKINLGPEEKKVSDFYQPSKSEIQSEIEKGNLPPEIVSGQGIQGLLDSMTNRPDP